MFDASISMLKLKLKNDFVGSVVKSFEYLSSWKFRSKSTKTAAYLVRFGSRFGALPSPQLFP